MTTDNSKTTLTRKGGEIIATGDDLKVLAEANSTDLEGADLEGVDLRGADFRDAEGIWAAKSPSGRIIYAVDHASKIMWQVGCGWDETQEIVDAISEDYSHWPEKRDAYIAIIEAGVKTLEINRWA